jgi:hypothetical protein
LTRNRCIACGADSIRLSSLFASRRRNIGCANCGTRFEAVIPPWPYHIANYVLWSLGSVALPVGIIMWSGGNGMLFLELAAALVLVAVGVQLWLARLAVLQRVSDSGQPIYQRRFVNESFDSDPR